MRIPLLLSRSPKLRFACSEAAASFVLVLVAIAILSLIAGHLIFSASVRYHTTYQSASWQEALIGSEAGVDLAMNELRKRVLLGPDAAFQATAGWTLSDAAGTPYPDSGRAFPADGQPRPFGAHGGEGNATMSARVFVDVPGSGDAPVGAQSFAQTQPLTIDPFVCEQNDRVGFDPGSHWWYRIRALGVTGVSGPAPRPSLDPRDNRLRRFSFFNDWRTGRAVSVPQVSRLVEVVAKPRTSFRNAIMADQRIDLNDKDVLIDSYDSAKGAYDPVVNNGALANLATNGQLINAHGAVVRGDAMTNDGRVADAENISGQQRSDFYQELPPVKSLTGWETEPSRPTITDNATFTASSDRADPTRIRLSGINLGDGKTVGLLGPVSGVDGSSRSRSYIKVFVEGDISTQGTGAIVVGQGVNAIFYFTGDVSLQGDGLVVNGNAPSRVLLNGLEPPPNADGSRPSRAITVATNQDFQGMIYAPNHDLRLAQTAAADSGSSASGGLLGTLLGTVTGLVADTTLLLTHALPLSPAQAQDHAAGYNGIYGAFVAKTITVEAKTHVHYDEALREAGPVNYFEIVNWFEDNTSRATASW